MGANGIVRMRDNTIVLGGYGARDSGLRTVSANGGALRVLTKATAGAKGHLHMNPVALFDNEHIVFTDYGPGGAEDDFVSVTSLAKGDVTNSSIVGLPLGYPAGSSCTWRLATTPCSAWRSIPPRREPCKMAVWCRWARRMLR